MTYALDIELGDPLDSALDDILGEVEEALESIRKYRPERVTHTEEVDVDALLAEHRAVALWDIQHVKDQRPELSDEQAWEVLQECQRCWDRLTDPMRETIHQVAENLFPPRRKPRPSKAGEIIAAYGDGDERKNLVDLLSDTMHWCEGFGESFDQFCGTARLYFAKEATTYRKGE